MFFSLFTNYSQKALGFFYFSTLSTGFSTGRATFPQVFPQMLKIKTVSHRPPHTHSPRKPPSFGGFSFTLSLAYPIREKGKQVAIFAPQVETPRKRTC
ncbi:MAG: hypothetical protein IKY18_03675, partial [Oscillospiraceae bacterium]|nr:hypothetical protein [Oscillospiraceae bacterium]